MLSFMASGRTVSDIFKKFYFPHYFTHTPYDPWYVLPKRTDFSQNDSSGYVFTTFLWKLTAG